MADGNGTKPFEAPPMDLIVQERSSDTLLNCACIVEFMGKRLSESVSADREIDDNDRDAIYRILSTVGAALSFEYHRASERERLLGEAGEIIGDAK